MLQRHSAFISVKWVMQCNTVTEVFVICCMWPYEWKHNYTTFYENCDKSGNQYNYQIDIILQHEIEWIGCMVLKLWSKNHCGCRTWLFKKMQCVYNAKVNVSVFVYHRVFNRWTGLLEWNTGMDYWTDPFCTKNHFYDLYGTYTITQPSRSWAINPNFISSCVKWPSKTLTCIYPMNAALAVTEMVVLFLLQK